MAQLVKITKAVRERIEKVTDKRYVIETAYGTRGHYEIRYSFDDHGQALSYYNSLLIHSGYKKRMLDMELGHVCARYLS